MSKDVVKNLCDLVEDLCEGRETYLHEYVDAALNAAKYIEELQDELAKALEALDEAVYLLAPDDKDMMRKAGVYRIVTTLAELKGQDDECRGNNVG